MITLVAVHAAYAVSVEHHVAQARQFVKKGWYDDAASEIEAGLRMPEGATDFELNWLGAHVYYERLDIDRAAECAVRAVESAPEGQGKDRAIAYHSFLTETFGWVQIRGPRDGLSSRLQLELTSMIFDVDLKRLINKKALEVREPTRLPVRAALPAGDYLINGAAVHVAAGASATLTLQLNQLGEEGLAALQVTRFDIAAGMSALLSDRVSNLHPGGAVELSLTQPVGPILLAGMVDWDARSYSTVGGGDVLSPWAISGGLRVAREIVVGGPLALRPGVGARYALVPGVQVDCHGPELECTTPGTTEPELRVYTVGRAIVPFAELDLQYREAGRTTALGVGVRVVGEYWIGSIPDGDAVLHGDTSGVSYGYSTQPSDWSAVGIRLLANVSIAF